jgi:hypothetical protein
VKPVGGKGKIQTHTLLKEDISLKKNVLSEVFFEILRSVSPFCPHNNVNNALLFIKLREVK